MEGIKFRAWHKEEKTMWKVLRLPLSFLGGALLLHSYHDEGETMQEDKNIDDYVITQFIGYKDRNGKEIYNGDIIKADWHWEAPHEVRWPADNYYMIECGLDGSNIEVIGNIYENPELMEKGEGR